MTPKEKAQELIEKFNYHVEKRDFFGDPVEHRNTKQCALIAVDEVIKEKAECSKYECYGEDIKFWKKVKTEIEKL